MLVTLLSTATQGFRKRKKQEDFTAIVMIIGTPFYLLIFDGKISVNFSLAGFIYGFYRNFYVKKQKIVLSSRLPLQLP